MSDWYRSTPEILRFQRTYTPFHFSFTVPLNPSTEFPEIWIGELERVGKGGGNQQK